MRTILYTIWNTQKNEVKFQSHNYGRVQETLENLKASEPTADFKVTYKWHSI